MINKINFLKIIIILTILGFFLSSYLTYSHIMFRRSPEYKSGCSWFSTGEDDLCKTVDASKYSEVFGLPVASLGAFYFLFILALSILKFAKFIFLTTLAGIIIYIYLIYLEIFVIKVICPLCVITSIINLLIFLFSIILPRTHNNASPESVGCGVYLGKRV